MDAYEYMTNRWTNPFKFMTAESDDDHILPTENHKPRYPSGCRKGVDLTCERLANREIPVVRKSK